MIHKKIDTNIVFLFFISIFPISYILGTALADINLVIIVLLFLVSAIIKKDTNQIFKNQFIILFLIFWFYLLIVSLFAINKSDSFGRSLPYLRYILFICSIIYFFNKLTDKQKKFLFIFIFFIITFFTIDLHIQHFFGSDIFGIKKPGNDVRVNGLFGFCIECKDGKENNRYIAGSFLITFAPLYLIYFRLLVTKFVNSIISYNIFIYSIFLIFFVSILITGDRISYIKFPLFFLLYFVFIHLILEKNMKFFIIFFLILILTLLASIQMLNSDVCTKLNNTLSLDGFFCIPIQRFNDLKDTIILFENSSYYKIFSTGFLVWLNNPVFGVGLKNFRHACMDFDLMGCTTHPHNFYLEILSETGIFGLIIFLIIIVAFIILFFKEQKNEKDYEKKFVNFMFLMSLIILFWPIGTTGSFYGNSQGPLIYYFIGLSLANLSKNNLNIKKFK